MNIFTGQKTIDLFQPAIELKRRLKKIKISGVSRMADPSEFYSTLSSTLHNYFHEFNKMLILEFQLDYINTGSAKWIYCLLAGLEVLHKEGGMLQVVWYFEKDDEAIEEAGEDLQANLKLPFELKTLN